MEIDSEVGNIIIKHHDGGESHLLPPEFNNFDDDGKIQEKIILVVSDSLGSFSEVSEYNHEEEKANGIYSVSGKSYKSEKYKLDVIQNENYFGASGGTEQIILAILSGVAGGIATMITNKIFEVVADQIKTAYSGSISDRSLDARQHVIEKILIKRFKANKPIQYLKIKHRKNVTECEVEDFHKKKYTVQAKEQNGVLQLDIQPA